jgi:hypothetical protein
MRSEAKQLATNTLILQHEQGAANKRMGVRYKDILGD